MIKKTIMFLSMFLISSISIAADYLVNKDSKVCPSVLEKVSTPGFDFKDHAPSMKKRKKVFIGDSLRSYNKNDFYLYTYAYDVNDDQKIDLVAIDWNPRGGNNFYLAFYVYSEKGYVYDDNKILQNFLKKKQFKNRHNKDAVAKSESPVFPEWIEYSLAKGERASDSFVGYYAIMPMIIENKTFIVAKKERSQSNNWMVFDFSRDIQSPTLVCFIQQSS